MSLASFALFLAGYEIQSVDFSKEGAFIDGMKSLFRQAGLEGKPIGVIIKVCLHSILLFEVHSIPGPSHIEPGQYTDIIFGVPRCIFSLWLVFFFWKMERVCFDFLAGPSFSGPDLGESEDPSFHLTFNIYSSNVWLSHPAQERHVPLLDLPPSCDVTVTRSIKPPLLSPP